MENLKKPAQHNPPKITEFMELDLILGRSLNWEKPIPKVCTPTQKTYVAQDRPKIV